MGDKLLTSATERYADGCPRVLPGVVEVIAAELRPPPEHEGKPLHWVALGDLPPSVWAWMRSDPRHSGGIWQTSAGVLDFPSCAALAGYRYLGPAEWKPSRVGEIAAELEALEPAFRPDLPYPGASNIAAARIAELEAEVARLKAQTASGARPAVHDPDLNVTMILPADWAASTATPLPARALRFSGIAP